MNKTASAHLKPCPFCGQSEPLLEEHPAHTHQLAKWIPDHPGSWTIECPNCSTGFCRPSREDVIAAWNRRTPTATVPDPAPGGYPKDIENPDEWKAFLTRYLDNRVTNEVHNGIGLVALHIVDAIRDARAGLTALAAMGGKV